MTALVRYRHAVIVALAIVVGLLSPAIQRAAVPDNTLTVWFLENDPGMVAYRDFQRDFGNDEVALIHVEVPGSVWDQEHEPELRRIESAVAGIDGIARVHSIFSLLGPGGLPLWPESLPAEQRVERLTTLAEHAWVRDRLVDASGAQAVFLVQLGQDEDIDAVRPRILADIAEVLAASPATWKTHLGGVGVIYSGLDTVSREEFGRLLGLGSLLLFGAMMVLFRSLRMAFAAVAAVAVGAGIALAAMGLVGRQVNMVTVLLPTMITVLGVTDAAHFPAAWQRFVSESNPRVRAVQTLRAVALPCLWTTLTTAAAFAVLVQAPMQVVRDLGAFGAIGIVAAYGATMAVMAWAMAGAKPNSARTPPWLERGLARLAAIATRHSRLTVASFAVICGLLAIPATGLRVDSDSLSYFPSEHRVVRDHQAIVERWGDYGRLEFLVRPLEGGADDPAVLEASENFERAARELSEVRDVLGEHTLRRGAVGEPTTVDENQRRSGESEFLSADGKSLRITVIGPTLGARDLSQLIETLTAKADESFAGVASVRPAGYVPLYVKIIDYVVRSQVTGLALSIVLMFGSLLALTRSWALAAIGLVPNLVPVLAMFGVAGILRLDLDIATAGVAAIVIGVAIDDTVHYMHAYRAARRQGLSWQEATDRTIADVGPAATYTTLLLLSGYAVLMVSDVHSVFAFGALTSTAAVAALGADLLLLPALLRPLGEQR